MLLDDTSNRASEPIESSLAEDSIDNGPLTSSEQQAEAARQEIYSDDADRDSLSYRAGKAYQQKNIASRKAADYVGEKLLGDKAALAGNTDVARERTKAIARKKARQAASKRISEKIGDKGMRTGFKKGLSREAGTAASEGAKRLGKAAGKKLSETAVQSAAKTGIQQVAGKGIGTAVGAATGVETFGLGFLLGLLLNIAISLGVNDAVEALFELKSGNVKYGTFLAIRAASKVGMFIWLLVCLLTTLSVAGAIIGLPMLLLTNIYMFCGWVFPGIPYFQGLVWWEMLIIVLFDFFAFIILISFLAGVGWFLCGGDGIANNVVGVLAAIYAWWDRNSGASVAAEFCSYVNLPIVTPVVQ